MILFFGVPNQGLHIDELGLAAMVKDQPNEDFLFDLRHGSPYLRNLSSSFCSAFPFRDSTVISFYETEESPTAQKVVISCVYKVITNVSS
jgi:hypothetical protein